MGLQESSAKKQQRSVQRPAVLNRPPRQLVQVVRHFFQLAGSFGKVCHGLRGRGFIVRAQSVFCIF